MRRRSHRPVSHALAGLCAFCLAAPFAAPAAARVRQIAVAPHAAARPLVLGVTSEDADGSLADVARFERAAGRRARLISFYSAFGLDDFDSRAFDRIAAHRATPMVTWEPYDWRTGVDQPRFALARIAGGAFDDYVRRWATAAAAWRRPLYLRFAPEMNGNWRPWCEGVNGNGRGSFVAAWRHVHDLFAAAGARNVRWVWSPNVVFPGSTPLARLYPGTRYVDVVGVDGYNWGTTQPWSRWQSFESLFGRTLRIVDRLARRPVLVSEVASAEQGGSKAAWITSFVRSLRRYRAVRGFVWFNEDKEVDWRIDSSPAAQHAFARALSSVRLVAP